MKTINSNEIQFSLCLILISFFFATNFYAALDEGDIELLKTYVS